MCDVDLTAVHLRHRFYLQLYELAVAKVGIVFEMGKLLGEIFSEIGLADAQRATFYTALHLF